ncbi:MAG: hypothetical protein ABW217_20805, partial [Polyangiaceae bacterium]
EPPSKLRPGLSVTLERAILRAMSADPRGRFEHIRDLGRALLEVADVRTQTLWGPSFGFKRSPALMASSSSPPPQLPAPNEPTPGSKGPSRWRSLAGFALAVLGLALLWTLTRPDAAPPETSANETPAAAGTAKPAALERSDTPPVVPAPPEPAVAQQAPEPAAATGKRALNPSDGSKTTARAKAEAREAGAREVRSDVRSLRESTSASTRRAQPRNAAPARANRRATGKGEEDLQQFFPQEGGRERNAAGEPSGEDTPVRNEAPILD